MKQWSLNVRAEISPEVKDKNDIFRPVTYKNVFNTSESFTAQCYPAFMCMSLTSQHKGNNEKLGAKTKK